MKLREDIVSNFRGFIYAKKGTEVKLISREDHVAIVENVLTGDRFSCGFIQLVDDETIIDKVEPASLSAPIKKINKPVAAQKKIVVQPLQKTLF